MTRGRVRVVHGTRVITLSRAAGALLAVPVLLAVGTIAAAAFLAGVSALMLAPRLRGFDRGTRPRRGGTVTLDACAYRRVDDPPGAQRDAPGVPSLPTDDR